MCPQIRVRLSLTIRSISLRSSRQNYFNTVAESFPLVPVSSNLIPAYLESLPVLILCLISKVTYFQNYGVGAGNALSSSFSRASKKAFSWSNGFHGLRHTYVQERMHHLVVENHIDYDESLEIVSQELGHFRPSITLAYLR